MNIFSLFKKKKSGGLRLRLCTPRAENPDSIPGQRTRSHKPQLRVCMPKLKKTLHTATGKKKKDPVGQN